MDPSSPTCMNALPSPFSQSRSNAAAGLSDARISLWRKDRWSKTALFSPIGKAGKKLRLLGLVLFMSTVNRAPVYSVWLLDGATSKCGIFCLKCTVDSKVFFWLPKRFLLFWVSTLFPFLLWSKTEENAIDHDVSLQTIQWKGGKTQQKRMTKKKLSKKILSGGLKKSSQACFTMILSLLI